MEMTRRKFGLGFLGAGLALGVAACGGNPGALASGNSAVLPTARATSGRLLKYTLEAKPTRVDLGGRVVNTWAFGNTIPGIPLRATAGDRVQVAFKNSLPMATSVHWHGLQIVNAMDGVPGVTTPETPTGGTFDFDFVVPNAGTHWFHPHHGLQMDRGLYAPFIVDEASEPGAYDAEWILMLDDWTDDLGQSPEQIMAGLQSAGGSESGGMGGMDMGGGMSGGMSGMDGGDVTYPAYLINGRMASDPDTLTAKPGQRVRMRIINASADTIFTVALDGHDLGITHTDGYAVQPITTQALRLGMGERYDAVVTLGDGVFTFAAQPYGKQGMARALVRTGGGAVPEASYRPGNLNAQPLTVGSLQGTPGTALPSSAPDTVQDLVLAGAMAPYEWTMNGSTYENTNPLTIRTGQMGRLRIVNQSMMSHPIHLHGHSFQIGDAGGSGPRKDTVLVPAMGAVNVDLIADNPGKWMVHCHNAYHAEAGMMTRLDYAI
ncbi:MAG: multicopper oxidase family protein [Actinomycetota bacterium]|nr:multicopper oxidase family protein [Actinomycetota bacterium]